MTKLALAILLSAVSTAAMAEEATTPSPFELSIEIVPRQPRPGDRIYVLGRLRNVEYNRELLVPSDIRSWLRLSAFHGNGAGIRVAGPKVNGPPIEWISFKGKGTIEVAAEVGELTDVCKRGCPAGRLLVTLSLDPTREPQRDGNHFVPPRMQASETVQVAPEETPVLSRSEDQSSVRITPLSASRRGEKGVAVKVRVENMTTLPLWVPRPADFAVSSCSVNEPSGAGSGMGGNMFPRGREKATTRDWVLLQPKKSIDVQVLCPLAVKEPGGTVELEMGAPPADQFAPDFFPPFVWWGTRSVGPVKIR